MLEGYDYFREEMERQADEDEALKAFIEELGLAYKGNEPPPKDRALFSAEFVGAGMFIIFAFYFLFRFGKDRLDHQRATQETSVLERRVALVQKMVEDGWTRKDAESMVNRGLEVIEKRTRDDPAFTSFLAVATKCLSQLSPNTPGNIEPPSIESKDAGKTQKGKKAIPAAPPSHRVD